MRTFLLLSACLLAAVVLADDLHDLSSNDEPISLDAAGVPATQTPDLGEEEKFGFGGLMTSGSFIMSSTGFEEEEELGEGKVRVWRSYDLRKLYHVIDWV